MALNATKKICNKCGQEKWLDEFPSRRTHVGTTRYDGRCRECERERSRARAKDPDFKAKRKQWRKTYSPKPYREMTKAQKAKVNAANKRYVDKKVKEIHDAYIAEHGSLPLCECGCGEECSGYNYKSQKWNRFKNGHYCKTPDGKEALRRSNEARIAKNVPIETLRDALREYKTKHGVTWKQMAAQAGISESHIHSLMFDHRMQVRGVTQKWLDDFLARFNGKKSEPTRHQKRTYLKKEVQTTMLDGRVVGLIIMKNEASRYLHACLEWHAKMFDELVIVDDGSTDGSYELAMIYTHNVVRRPADVPSFMEDESALRQFAWRAAEQILDLRDGDFIFALDTDEFFVPKSGDPREAIDAYRKAILWEDKAGALIHIPEVWQSDGSLHTRVDGYWNSNSHPRLVRWSPNRFYARKKAGCGPVPTFYMELSRLVRDKQFGELLHFGYLSAEDRQGKFDRYTSMADHGHNKTHVNSILTKPRLSRWEGVVPEWWRGIASE